MESWSESRKKNLYNEIETRMMGYNGITHYEYFIIIFLLLEIQNYNMSVLGFYELK